MSSSKYEIGQHVKSWDSGLTYVVKAVHDLDMTGNTFAYTVRRLRGGVEWGPTRVIGECRLDPDRAVLSEEDR
jgi:hypothetical protein